MLYLIQHIIFCLLFIAVIGVAVGWLLRGVGSSRQSDLVAAEWRARIAHLESRNEALAVTDPNATAARDLQTDALRQRLSKAEHELATLRTARAVRTQTEGDDSVREELRETRIVCQQLQGHVAEQQTLVEQLKKRLQLAATERETLIGRLREAETRYARLNQERQHAIDTVASLQRDLRASHATQAAAARRNHGDEEAPPAAAPAETAVRATRALKAETAASGPGNGPAAQQDLPIADTASPPETEKPYEPAWRLSAPDGARDNLQAVYGIGPKLEQRLNELGVFHFRQIAAFDKPDILWVARHLKSFPGRILRDRWVEQARSLEKRRRAGQPI